jgi:hypothetical protein
MALHALGVGDDRIYVDSGLIGTDRDPQAYSWPWPAAVRPPRAAVRDRMNIHLIVLSANSRAIR